MIEIWLIITSGILAILYWLELLKNIKLEKERDIETFEKNKLETRLKQKIVDMENLRKSFKEEREQTNSNSDFTMDLIKENETLKTKVDLKTKKIAELNSRVQSRDKIIAKLKENGKVQV
mgnify:CR=1 FL=1